MIVVILILSSSIIFLVFLCTFFLIDRRRWHQKYESYVQHSSMKFQSEQRKLKDEFSKEHLEKVLLKERVEKQELLLFGYHNLFTDIRSTLSKSIKKDYKNMSQDVRSLIIQMVEFAKYDDSYSDVPVSIRKKANFINKLTSMYPDITESSAQLAYMIAINMPVPAICQILGINAKSVQMARFRMRKKMRLNESDSLEDTLQQLF